MSHAITIGGLLATLGLIGGILIFAISLLALFAEGMSDAPTGDGKGGCFGMVFGLALAIACTFALFHQGV